jgi:hypothetical protein
MNKDITNATLLMIAELAGEHIMPDGRKVQITVVEQAKAETELSAKFEDCFERQLPMVFLTTFVGNIPVPTERNAKQLQAFSKLLVIMHDLNSGEWIPKNEEQVYTLVYDRESNSFLVESRTYTNDSPIYFRTRELAKKALEANEQIFRDFYGV